MKCSTCNKRILKDGYKILCGCKICLTCINKPFDENLLNEELKQSYKLADDMAKADKERK